MFFPPIRWVNWPTYLAESLTQSYGGHHDPLVRCGWRELEVPKNLRWFYLHIWPKIVYSPNQPLHLKLAEKGNIDPMLNDHGLASWLQPTSMSYTVSGFVWNRAPLNAQLNHQVPPKMGHGLTPCSGPASASPRRFGRHEHVAPPRAHLPHSPCGVCGRDLRKLFQRRARGGRRHLGPLARDAARTADECPQDLEERWQGQRVWDQMEGWGFMASDSLDGELTQSWGFSMVFRGFDLEGLRLPTVGCLESAARDSAIGSHWELWHPKVLNHLGDESARADAWAHEKMSGTVSAGADPTVVQGAGRRWWWESSGRRCHQPRPHGSHRKHPGTAAERGLEQGISYLPRWNTNPYNHLLYLLCLLSWSNPR